MVVCLCIPPYLKKTGENDQNNFIVNFNSYSIGRFPHIGTKRWPMVRFAIILPLQPPLKGNLVFVSL